MTNILCTCPAMIRAIDALTEEFARREAEVFCPEMQQILPVGELLQLVPQYDGWIIGDDPATAEVFQAGRAGRLRAAVKWGAGTDNVDFVGAASSGFHVVNTPGTFGEEVSDVAVAYVIGLARELFFIDRGVRSGNWPKPAGTSLQGKSVGIMGYGHIGRALVRKLTALGMNAIIYDPIATPGLIGGGAVKQWPERLEEIDFLILTCSLNSHNTHIINKQAFDRMRRGVRIVNVSRGGLIDHGALLRALESGQVASAALEVFEEEPPPMGHPLLSHPGCVFGSHNGSNTVEAVNRTSMLAVKLLFDQLATGK